MNLFRGKDKNLSKMLLDTKVKMAQKNQIKYKYQEYLPMISNNFLHLFWNLKSIRISLYLKLKNIKKYLQMKMPNQFLEMLLLIIQKNKNKSQKVI